MTKDFLIRLAEEHYGAARPQRPRCGEHEFSAAYLPDDRSRQKTVAKRRFL